MNEKPRPVITKRYGTLSAAVWENTNRQTGSTFYAFTFTRSYFETGGADPGFRSTKSFNLGDLPTLALLVEDIFRELRGAAARPDKK